MINSNYTQQKDLGLFGARWGCYFTVFLNIIETEIGRKLLKDEVSILSWEALLDGCVLFANYKDHERLYDPYPGWSERADPEWHYYVLDPERLLKLFEKKMKISVSKNVYEIVTYHTGTYPDGKKMKHFTLKISGEKEVNPDPKITGKFASSLRV